jgi:hypothetical protein
MKLNKDLVNGGFEFIGGIICWLNVCKLYQDKQIKGVSVSASIFFTLFAIWGVYYYPNLNQPFSFVGAICLAAGNLSWLILLSYFLFKR